MKSSHLADGPTAASFKSEHLVQNVIVNSHHQNIEEKFFTQIGAGKRYK